MSSPYISVIVTAYDRKKYLLGAVKSALNQTLPRDRYEVIVVKNFRGDFIDSKLEEWGVTNLYSESVGLGAKVYEALQVAKGDVTSPLEDDDEFLPGKLGAVYEAF
jgi:glycosyltransferase involved in cell wall biosynthesis